MSILCNFCGDIAGQTVSIVCQADELDICPECHAELFEDGHVTDIDEQCVCQLLDDWEGVLFTIRSSYTQLMAKPKPVNVKINPKPKPVKVVVKRREKPKSE